MVKQIINASIIPLTLFVSLGLINDAAHQAFYSWPYLLLVHVGYFGLSVEQPNLVLLNLAVALSLIMQIIVILAADLYSVRLRRK